MFPFIAARRSPNTDPVVVPAFLFGPFRRSWRSPSCDSLVSFRSSRPYFGVKYRALSYKNVSSGKTLTSAFGRAHFLAIFVGGHILWECVSPEDKPKAFSSGKTHSHWNVSCRRTPTMWMCLPVFISYKKENVSSQRHRLVSSGKTHFYRREPWVRIQLAKNRLKNHLKNHLRFPILGKHQKSVV